MKDAYYFSHDSNAKDDPKCVLLIETLQLEGYGIFWILVETLRDQPDYRYPLALIPAIARRYNTTAEKVKSVVTKFGLFQIENEEFFYSESLDKRMEFLDNKREQYRLAGIKSGESRRQKALEHKTNDVQTTFNGKTNESEQVNKSKVNKIKHKYGEYQHVLLTDKQYEDLKGKVDDREKWIKILDESIEEKGNIYKIKNFYLAALKWYKKEIERTGEKPKTAEEIKRREEYRKKIWSDE